MELPSISLLSITPIYVAILGLVMVPITLRVGLYRLRNQVDLGDGGDKALLRLIRGQANFVETVPLAVALLVVMELMGASDAWLHALGAALVTGRVLHYLGLTGMGPFVGRPAGMVLTFTTYLVSSGWILVAALG
ncbi:MAG: MAPEG family protein [Pseudomonadota bacterium]